MQFEFQVSVEVERSEGKFESRDDIEAEIVESLEAADPGTIEGPQYQGTYDVQTWDVQPLAAPKATKKPAADAELLRYLRALRGNLDTAAAGPDESPDRAEAIRKARNLLDGVFLQLSNKGLIKPE